MSDPAKLSQQIEQLSAANRSKAADYIAFLLWQEEQRQLPEINSWSYSLIEAFKGASVYASQDPAGMDVKLAQATVGGQSQPALWAHPPLMGQAIIEYHLPVPQQVNTIRLHLSFGIRDGAQISDDNLIAFSVRINGIRVWGQQTNAQQWQPATIPLDLPVGDMVRLELTTETLGSHEWTWAVWGTPELTGKGNGAK
ncbi:MAG: hypothetical protein KDF65_01430 [Anaerolineae bacterium]|nr:hypothetical protein [Anaerolineae bacterium]